MLSCEEMVALLGEYLDDEVAASIRERTRRHLAHCRACSVLFDSATKTLQVVSESGSFEVPSGLSERILAAVRARRGGDGAKG